LQKDRLTNKLDKRRAVKVKYTVNPEFVEQNKPNIRKVMNKLKNKPIKSPNSYKLDLIVAEFEL